MTNSPLVEVRGLRKSFGQVEVLHGVDLDLAPGQVTALLGENGAGKSTFVKILSGDYRQDHGTITMGGADISGLGISAIRKLGLRVISQELADAPALSVAENISLGSWPLRGLFVDRRKMKEIASEVLEALGSDLDPDRLASTLRLGERQVIEIARAMAGDLRVVVFDEPTAALSDTEAQQLFAVIRQLTARGIAVLYITHRLDEVFAIADRTVVLRDGLVSLDSPTSNTNAPEIIEAMVGRRVEVVHYGKSADADLHEGGLSIVDATGEGFVDVNVEAPRGSVTGLYGKVGSGVVEIAEALFGARMLQAGQIEKDGQVLTLRTPADAIAAGIGFLPADRKGDALLPSRSVAENLSAPSWKRLSKRGFIGRRAEADAYARWHQTLGVRSQGHASQIITTLSGGNQQKVLLGRWLEKQSNILVLTEPTRGVDVGARQEIYQLLRSLADRGVAVIIASSDYEDILALADTVQVFIGGREVAKIHESDISVGSLTHAAGGAIHV